MKSNKQSNQIRVVVFAGVTLGQRKYLVDTAMDISSDYALFLVRNGYARLNADFAMSAYSGKAHHCCCGCAGKHSYASVWRMIASRARGYRVEDEEINDRTVKLIAAKVTRAIFEGSKPINFSSDCVSVESSTRTYVVYFAEAK